MARPTTHKRIKRRKASSKTRRRRKGPKAKRKASKLWSRLWKSLGIVLVLGIFYVVYLDIQIRSQFEGKRWALPAHVYARPLELYQGIQLTAQRFAQELKLLGYRVVYESHEPGTYSSQNGQFRIHTRPFQFWDGQEPARVVDVHFAQGAISVLRDGKSKTALSLLRLDPMFIGGIFPSHHEDRILIKLENAPKQLIQALMTVEDRSFTQHYGVDPRAVARAIWANLQAGGAVQGGSTLTQQLVKNFFLTNERTLWRKSNEAIMALLLELHYDKQEILQAYLNEIYLGQQGKRAIHGFGLASHFYFDKPIEKLNLPQTALLIALVRGPSYYNPHRHPKRLRARRNRILDTLVEQKVVNREKASKAKQAALGVIKNTGNGITPYPAFMNLVRRQLRRDYREQDLTSEGLKIFTTLDPLIQKDTEQVVSKRVKQLDKRRKLNSQLQAAAVVTSTSGGEVLALVSDRNVRFAGFNRALDARRPIGSLVKPAVYLTALQQAEKYSLITRLDDSPIRLRGANGEIWAPRNYDGVSHSHAPMYIALTHSYNQAMVRLGMDIGVPKVVTTLQRLGIEREIKPYPSLLLGAVSLSPYEVTQMYQTLAAGGFRSPLRAIRAVLNVDATPLQRYPLHVEQSVDVAAVQVLNSGLIEVVRNGTARSVRSMLPAGLIVAGKTGTTDDLRDSWFAGFSADHTVTVWLGTDNNKPIGLSGASGALTLWGDIINRINTRSIDQLSLDQIEYVAIDPSSLLRADEGCSERVPLAFIKGSAPTEFAACAENDDSEQTNTTLEWFKALWD